MADCISAQIVEEIGTVLTNIAVSGGYSTETAVVNYKDQVLDRVPATGFPCHDVIALNRRAEEVTSSTHIIRMSFLIESYRILTYSAALLTGRKQLLEFETDIRNALFSTYARQQAGTFVCANFLNIENFEQKIFAHEIPTLCGGVHTTCDYTFDATFTER